MPPNIKVTNDDCYDCQGKCHVVRYSGKRKGLIFGSLQYIIQRDMKDLNLKQLFTMDSFCKHQRNSPFPGNHLSIFENGFLLQLNITSWIIEWWRKLIHSQFLYQNLPQEITISKKIFWLLVLVIKWVNPMIFSSYYLSFWFKSVANWFHWFSWQNKDSFDIETW